MHPQSIRRWAAAGLIRTCGKDDRGRNLYDYDEVEAFVATRRRAHRAAGEDEFGYSAV